MPGAMAQGAPRRVGLHAGGEKDKTGTEGLQYYRGSGQQHTSPTDSLEFPIDISIF